MNKKLIPVLLSSTVVLTACLEDKKTESDVPSAQAITVTKENAIASVNGKYISKKALAALEQEIAQRSQGQSFPQDKLIEELVQRELLIQDALKNQLDKSAEFTERVETIKQSLLSQAAIQNHFKSNEITDADLEAEYNKNIALAGEEFKARHILVKSEDEAKQLITELSTGADFAELAKSKSTGPSGPQGGDLGWFAAGQMVVPFSDAVIALEDNKFTTEPVKTQFGWHVILREGSRKQTPPPFESIKEQLRPMLQRQKMQQYLESLRSSATVEVLLAPTPAVEPAADKNEENAAAHSHSHSSTENVIEEAVNNAKEEITDSADSAAKKLTETAEKAKDSAVENATSVVKPK